jgi:iron complex transport system substrate-binding protein
MRRAIGLLLFCCVCAGCSRHAGHDAVPGRQYHRVISFAPSITETLFALGVGDRVVGVTRYCTYPPQVNSLPRIGGYLDPNFEMILSLRPDLVILLREHSSIEGFLRKNGIEMLVIDNEDLDEIMQSFRTFGALFGRTRQADSLVASIRTAVVPPAGESRPRVLLCIGRDNPGAGVIAKAYVAGPKSFYSKLIDYAGGHNAYTDSSFVYPSFSAEGIIRLSPDIIIDLMASVSGVQPIKAVRDWDCLSMVPAVKNKLVFCPKEDFMTIPGPRIGRIVSEIKNAVDLYRPGGWQ